MAAAVDTSLHGMSELESWVARLVRDHRMQLARVARREGVGAEDALDVVQEAFLTFLRLPDASRLIRQEEDSRKLLIAVTRNLARNARRRHAVARPHDGSDGALEALPDGAPGAEERLAVAEQRAQLDECLGRLSGLPRAVVAMRLLEGAGGDEVARALGVTPGHVAVLLHRAKASLRSCMERGAP